MRGDEGCVKGFRRDFRRRSNRSCRPDISLVGREGGKGSTKLPPSGEDAAREAHGLRSGIRIGIILIKIPGNFPGIFPVFIPETDFLFSPRFRRACRVRTYFEYKPLVSMGKPVRNLFTGFSGFSFPKVSRSSVTEPSAVSEFESQGKVPPEIFPGKQYPDRLPRRLTVSRDKDDMNAHPCAGESPAGNFFRRKLPSGPGVREDPNPTIRRPEGSTHPSEKSRQD